jgi:diaminopropionate ammonia-lyase
VAPPTGPTAPISPTVPVSPMVVANPLAGPPPVWAPYTRDPLEFHRRFPGYEPTPLLRAPRLAGGLGVGELFIKCERARLGLMSFKILGASWACYRAIIEHTGQEPHPWATVEDLAASLKPVRPFTLAAATDGNHGRAVARVARLLGFDARIFVPEGTAPARIDAISGEGASVTVVAGDYEDAVARSAEEAGPRCLVISDTSWPGYEQVPRWVIEGYSTMFWEVDDRLADTGRKAPDVVVVPVGVGALAAATVNHWCRHPGAPTIIAVEPLGSNCVMASALAGQLVTVPGPHRSVMAGLNCGRPSTVAWPLVSAGLGTLVALDDEWARQAVRELAAAGIEAGETGAASLAGLMALQAQGAAVPPGSPAIPPGSPAIPPGSPAIPPGSTVLVLCTEGPTDPVEWRRTLGVELV